jgi:50S ribosomal subunit-associated GTPase HflX
VPLTILPSLCEIFFLSLILLVTPSVSPSPSLSLRLSLLSLSVCLLSDLSVSLLPISCSVLVGNKCDMISNRQVSYEAGEKLAGTWNVPFLETSAKTKQNNAECFTELVREIKKKEDQIRLTLHEANEEKSRCHCVLL